MLCQKRDQLILDLCQVNFFTFESDKAPEKVYSRENLYELVWRSGYYGENNTVNVHVSNLRKKIKEADPKNEYIRTVYGIGFQLK